MNDRARNEKQMLLDAIIEVSSTETWIQRPNVAVNMFFKCGLNEMQAFGFAKVARPDKWDEEFGKQLAKRKAAACVLKQAKKKGVDLRYWLAGREPGRKVTFGATLL